MQMRKAGNWHSHGFSRPFMCVSVRVLWLLFNLKLLIQPHINKYVGGIMFGNSSCTQTSLITVDFLSYLEQKGFSCACPWVTNTVETPYMGSMVTGLSSLYLPHLTILKVSMICNLISCRFIVCLSTHLNIYVCVYIHIHIYAYTFTYTYTYVSVCTCACVYIHTCTHIYHIGLNTEYPRLCSPAQVLSQFCHLLACDIKEVAKYLSALV